MTDCTIEGELMDDFIPVSDFSEFEVKPKKTYLNWLKSPWTKWGAFFGGSFLFFFLMIFFIRYEFKPFFFPKLSSKPVSYRIINDWRESSTVIYQRRYTNSLSLRNDFQKFVDKGKFIENYNSTFFQKISRASYPWKDTDDNLKKAEESLYTIDIVLKDLIFIHSKTRSKLIPVLFQEVVVRDKHTDKVIYTKDFYSSGKIGMNMTSYAIYQKKVNLKIFDEVVSEVITIGTDDIFSFFQNQPRLVFRKRF